MHLRDDIDIDRLNNSSDTVVFWQGIKKRMCVRVAHIKDQDNTCYMAGGDTKVDINYKVRDVTFGFKLFSIWTVLLYLVIILQSILCSFRCLSEKHL